MSVLGEDHPIRWLIRSNYILVYTFMITEYHRNYRLNCFLSDES